MQQGLTEVVTAIQGLLTSIAQQAGTLIERIWTILVKQQMIFGIQQMFRGIVYVIGGFVFIKLFSNTNKNKTLAVLDKKALLIVLLVLMGAAFYFGSQEIIDSFPRVFNPEYYSVKEAVQIIKDVRR